MDKRKEQILKELREISPELARIKEDGPENPFGVPVNYFRNLPTEIAETIAAREAPKTTFWAVVQQYFLRPQYAAAFAMLIALIIGGLYYLDSPSATSDPFDKLVIEDANDYILDNIDDFEELILDDALAMADMEDLPETEDQYEEYLLDELDESTLEEELL